MTDWPRDRRCGRQSERLSGSGPSGWLWPCRSARRLHARRCETRSMKSYAWQLRRISWRWECGTKTLRQLRMRRSAICCLTLRSETSTMHDTMEGKESFNGIRRNDMALAAEKEMKHLGESRGRADHDHDLVHDLGKRLDALWRYDQYIANAEDK